MLALHHIFNDLLHSQSLKVSVENILNTSRPVSTLVASSSENPFVYLQIEMEKHILKVFIDIWLLRAFHSPPYHGSHAMLDIALSGGWGFPRPVAAPEQWITRSNVLGLYSFCFNVSKCPSLSCLTLYLQSLCCFKAGMERKENICYWSHSSISCLSTKSTWLKGADSSNLTFLSGLALPYTNCI